MVLKIYTYCHTFEDSVWSASGDKLLWRTFLVADSFTRSSTDSDTARSMGSIRPRWIHLGMVVRACSKPSFSSNQLTCGLNWPLAHWAFDRRKRLGSSSQCMFTNCRRDGRGLGMSSSLLVGSRVAELEESGVDRGSSMKGGPAE